MSLLNGPDWRERLVGGWFVALTRRRSFVEEVGRLLWARERPFAGQGYCAALGILGGPRCEALLSGYLRAHLPPDEIRDQGWAIGALAHISNRAAVEFMDKALWTGGSRQLDPDTGVQRFAQVLSHLVTEGLLTDRTHGMPPTPGVG